MPKPHGFGWEAHSDGSVVITHQGRAAGTLRGERAAKFLAEAEADDSQLVMAHWTGAYNDLTHDWQRRRGAWDLRLPLSIAGEVASTEPSGRPAITRATDSDR
ncbi:hypothetical protein [Streptomyces sp. H27-C3]|uniref:hypothetical protein n=1 Tax=Streptomyces sp. H27-C3 TaxID=3046305 RepID=UPI0024BA9D8A|nr:hypothetical protein [Streptomyces sp. H27-C3]MDJ0461781.1 hypothetical protein [Streptomyces sp. H27-C3]